MGCAFAERGESGRQPCMNNLALDCRSAPQRRISMPFRLDSPERKRPIVSCTAALLSKQEFPMASSALKAGLYPGRFNRSPSPGVLRYSRTASSRWPGALFQIICTGYSAPAQGAFVAASSGRQPKSRHCCRPPVPSIPPLPSLTTPPLTSTTYAE